MSRILASAVFIALVLAACSRNESSTNQLVPKEAKPEGKRVYGPIEPVVLNLPEGVIKTLGGSDTYGKPLNKAFIYFKSFNLVVYRDSFDVKNYIESMGETFAQLLANKAFIDAADIWAIQMQQRGTSNFVVLALNPSQVKKYAESKEIIYLLLDADYLMINDKIIPPPERMDYYLGKISAPAPQGFSPNR
jgi:hypothetical protein